MHENSTKLEELADWLRKTAERQPKDREFVVPDWWRAAADAIDQAAQDRARLDGIISISATWTSREEIDRRLAALKE